MTSLGIVANHLSDGRVTVSRETSERVDKPMDEGLGSRGFPLEVWIGNDTPTFNTAHLTAVVFLLRDAVGDHTLVCTDAGRAHGEGLWCFL